jgi:hypothetical protein
MEIIMKNKKKSTFDRRSLIAASAFMWFGGVKRNHPRSSSGGRCVPPNIENRGFDKITIQENRSTAQIQSRY